MNQSDSYSAPMLDVDLTDVHGTDVRVGEGQPEARSGSDGAAASRPEASGDGEGAPAKGQDTPPAEVGYRGTTAHTVAGITYRQLDYWARTGLVVPSVRDASGSGTQRLYSFRDIVVLKVVKRLLDAGVSLQNIRKAIETLRRRGVEDLANVTLISDGTTVYECRSAEEIVDLLQGGQGVFAIALSGPFREIQGTLAKLPPTEVVEDASASAPSAPVDELAVRRARRRAG
ncbi:MAG TPA: MerR family transcriptional regulator [Acidimicrobiales bacterium]|jgi:DNA-binding transcriptional MerR regulator